MKNIVITALVIIASLIFLMFAKQSDHDLTLMATTTTQDSGILSHIVDAFEKDSGLKVKAIAYGTGKVLRSAKDGNADILLVHDPLNEDIFMKGGFGKERISIMQNDFVIIGPNSDPATVKMSNSASDAFKKIASKSIFVSRGDGSGTHNAEKRIWGKIQVDQEKLSPNNYIITGSGMGRTLGIAVEKEAYALTDRATWLSYKNKGQLSVLFENDSDLENIYSVISVNPLLFGHISLNAQDIFMEWIKSQEARETIQNFQINAENPYLAILP